MYTTFKSEQGNVYLYSDVDTLCSNPKFVGLVSNLEKVMKAPKRRVITTSKPDYNSFWYKVLGLHTEVKHKEIKREITINEISTFANGMKIAKQSYSTLLF